MERKIHGIKRENRFNTETEYSEHKYTTYIGKWKERMDEQRRGKSKGEGVTRRVYVRREKERVRKIVERIKRERKIGGLSYVY